MKSLTARKLIRILEKHGFVLARQRGSHSIYKHKITGLMVVIPLHSSSRILPIGTFLAIVRQSGLPKEKFAIGK